MCESSGYTYESVSTKSKTCKRFCDFETARDKENEPKARQKPNLRLLSTACNINLMSYLTDNNSWVYVNYFIQLLTNVFFSNHLRFFFLLLIIQEMSKDLQGLTPELIDRTAANETNRDRLCKAIDCWKHTFYQAKHVRPHANPPARKWWPIRDPNTLMSRLNTHIQMF